jgi:hypothetical protein
VILTVSTLHIVSRVWEPQGSSIIYWSSLQ